jgi:SpoVK/Ycf46/Vps4 family AAA+-type ATPase
MEMIMNISGLTSLVKPISSSEINRALVGESERILRDIFNRAKEFPYLLCVIFVDEIDSFAPDRGNASQAGGAMANVNQLLALMDGVTWVPNNYLIGATNFYNKLDGAFLRRLRTKILIPNLDTKQRLEVIQSLVTDDKILYAFREFLEHDENWKFNSELQNLLKKLTINFSAAATSELKEKIRIKILSEIEKDINFKITIDKIIDYADKIADNQNIKISGQTIPSFIKNKRDCPIVQRMKILLVELWLI